MLSNIDPLIFGVQVVVITMGSHVFATVFLMDVLARSFDPYWGPRLLQPIKGFTGRYLQTLYYAGAVHSKLVRRIIFENIPFDFRGRLDRRTARICAVYNVVSVLALMGLVFLAGWATWGAWHVWNDLPRTVPARIMYEEAITL